ncbi:cysteine desulfurase, partial [Gordonibacter urolithinfaciens]|nr:cysteine desulfurase [Gordonibacter urolithinfaciens]
MIYFDNAATTRRKPPEVAEAVARAIGSFGGVGRGVHEASIDAGMAVY